ncbi:PVC-type heme-binding CxxCH protein [Aureliella helgolandensis]|uniref:Cytochrome c n=1 Tax=Aureliella helgolandensis TaxID=2527968 RepID=A0A518G1E7_9BACT|nr:PVC-type heme-binding CxxCH protein [Aureliella helgolandensis]QDV22422.1 Cytochrome c [Aureliella helgolandensis]
MQPTQRIALAVITVCLLATLRVASASEFVPANLVVPEGYEVEVVAASPLVEHPTFATFDESGRLFVCENAGVNMSAAELEESLPNSIRMLVDSDGDGRFDKHTVFADKMTFPMGGAWHNGALYVASPPNIWRLADTTGDGVADDRKILVSGFGYTGNAASIHGCVNGPDGRIYWCDGFHGHEIKDDAGAVQSERFGSYLFSCLPNGSDLRLHAGGGMDNPVEVDFTDTGEMLGTVNILRTRPRVDALVHWLYGGAYPHRERVRQELKTTGEFLGPIHDFGHVAVSGTMRVRNSVGQPEWQNSFLATFFNIGKVVRLQLQREGASFNVVQREFLSSPSPEFHPTDIVEDADGSLLVVDTGGWFYRGCPTSQFAKPDVLGAIYRIRLKEAAVVADPRGMQILWDDLPDDKLVELLGDSRFVVRQRAIAACAARSPGVIPLLASKAEEGELRTAQNSLWALTQIVGSAASESETRHAAWAAIVAALQHSLPDMRQTACRSLATYPNSKVLEELLPLLQDHRPEVRRECATAIGRLGDSAAVAALLDALEQAVDRTEEHSLIYALIEINDPPTTRRGLQQASPRVQQGSLIALDQMDAGDLQVEEVMPLALTRDANLQRAAAEIFLEHPEWQPQAAQLLGPLLQRSKGMPLEHATTQRLLAQFVEQPQVRALVGRHLNDPALSASTRSLILHALAARQKIDFDPSWQAPLARMLEEREAATLPLAIEAIAAMDTAAFDSQLQDLSMDPSLPILLRVTLAQTLSGNASTLTKEAFELLVQEWTAGTYAASLEAAQRLGTASLSKAQKLELLPHFRTASPDSLRALLSPYARVDDAVQAGVYLDAIGSARSLTLIPPHEFSDMIKAYPVEALPQANAILQKIQQAEANKLVKLDRYLSLLAAGNAERGKKLFWDEKSRCGACHQIGKQGIAVGPDLTTIGANRSPQALLESVVFPSATIVRDYEPYAVALTDGRVLSGVIVRETTEEIFLQQQTGALERIARNDIEEMQASLTSIMPAGLDATWSGEELADLVAYLKQQQTAAPSTP